MGIFNTIGFILIITIMIPNVIYGLRNKNGFVNLYSNKVVEIFEQVGRFGCFIFMIVNLPFMYFNFWFNNAKIIYIVVNASMVFFYLLFWIVLWNKTTIFKALTLSILPSILFLFSGIMILNIPLICFSVIFATAHIFISFKNAVCFTRVD